MYTRSQFRTTRPRVFASLFDYSYDKPLLGGCRWGVHELFDEVSGSSFSLRRMF